MVTSSSKISHLAQHVPSDSSLVPYLTAYIMSMISDQWYQWWVMINEWWMNAIYVTGHMAHLFSAQPAIKQLKVDKTITKDLSECLYDNTIQQHAPPLLFAWSSFNISWNICATTSSPLLKREGWKQDEHISWLCDRTMEGIGAAGGKYSLQIVSVIRVQSSIKR